MTDTMHTSRPELLLAGLGLAPKCSVRSIRPTDDLALVEMAKGTGVFTDEEHDCLIEDLEDFHAGAFGVPGAGDDILVLVDENDRQLGFVHYGPLVITEQAWMVHWIVVAKSEQEKGLGRFLLKQVEHLLQARHARVLFIETSSLDSYLPTRSFYLRQGYHLNATVKEYYAAGVHKCIFTKLF